MRSLSSLNRWFLALALASACGCGAAPRGNAAVPGGLAAANDLTSTLMGDGPNFAQASNGRMMTVVSRERGRGAKAGALIELYYPNYAADHLWDSYVGVRTANGLRWAHDMHLLGQAMVPGTGVTTSSFEAPGLGLVIADAVDPAHDVHLRHVTVTNTGVTPLTGASLDAYAFFTLNCLPGGDVAHFDGKALLQHDGKTAVAMTTFPAPDAGRVGLANLPGSDARMEVEANRWNGPKSAGPMVTGVNGALRVPLPALAPGASTEVTVAFAIAPDEAAAVGQLHTDWAGAAQRDRERWAAWLGQSRMPGSLNADERAVYERALVTLGQAIADDGAIIAAPNNFSPLYRFVWPRDGTLCALTLMQAGHAREGKHFFEFCESLQRPDGGFAVNYFPDGRKPLWEFGPRGDEHDQVGLFAWGVAKAGAGDPAWLAARWPAVRKACEFLLSAQGPDGLMGKCRDLWELDTDGSWTWSNAAAWAGLNAGASLAPNPADAARYRAAADRLKNAIQTKLVVDGRYARGLRTHGLDATAEIANLGLGAPWLGFEPDTSPRMQATGAMIAAKLGTPSGAVRRHENDNYYGGNPWPVAGGWLALHQAATGDLAGARARFDVMTKQAERTEALMLGEQLDEHTGRWVGAFPLNWSEATYIRTALELK